MKLSPKTKRAMFVVLVLSVAFAVVGAAGIAGWEFTNSDTFCAVACHNVHPEEPFAHQASQHANVSCVECHMGRLSTFEIMATKITHTKHLWGVIMGYERPLTSPSMPTSRESCEGCHSEQSHQSDSILVRKHYAPDEKNTETTVRVIMKTGGESARQNGEKGIHWHTDKKNQVRFIATDEQEQKIPWVEVTKPDGEIVVYTDITQPLSESIIAESEKDLMECVDCHNRAGHHFVNPEVIIDDALATGWVSRDQPFIKARLKKLLEEEYSTKEEALELVAAAYEKYRKDFPDVYAKSQEGLAKSEEFVVKRQEAYANWLIRSKFRHPDVSWQSFQDLSGHKYTAGCFRCHSGKHFDDKGNPLSVNCTTCHNIPSIKEEFETASWTKIPHSNLKPKSHKAPDFILKHRNLLGNSCKSCHGQISYGKDNLSFCANIACHATEWPGLDLNASRSK
jgi:hypothetical protein